MITFILLTAVAALVPIAFSTRPQVWICAGFALAVLIPNSYISYITDGVAPLAEIHPASWLFMVGVIVTLVTRQRISRRLNLTLTPLRVVPLLSWVAVAAAVIVLFHGVGSLFPLFVFYVAPALAFFAIRLNSQPEIKLSKALVGTLVGLLIFEGALASLQWITGRAILFEEGLATQYWWTGSLTRSLGTLDSPLDLAALLSTGILTCAFVKRTLVAYPAMALAFAGVIFSGSRLGIVVAALTITLVIVYRSRNVFAAVITGMVVGAGSLLLVTSELGATLLARFGTRGQSSNDARDVALQFGLERLTDRWATGGGIGTAYDLGQYYLNSSMENGYLAAAIDIGIVLTLALLLVQLLLVLQGWPGQWVLRVMGLAMIVWGFAYSSFLSGSSISIIIWAIIGLASLAEPVSRSRRARQPPGGLTSMITSQRIVIR